MASPLADATAPVAVPVRPRTYYNVDLLQGTMSLTTADGSVVWGTYHGTATVPTAGQARATLAGEITGGTGKFAGATGKLEAVGTGGFANDGEFSAILHVTVSPGNDDPLDLAVVLNGISTSTCTTTAPPRMALEGTGRAKLVGNASAHLEHNLGSQICAIIIE